MAALLLVSMALQAIALPRHGPAKSAQPPPSTVQSPNLLLIVLDTMRARSLNSYGYARRTAPFLNELGQQGVVFERAIAPSPWTLPSHASMFTGRWPHELSTGWRSGLDERYPTVGELLRARGYRTVGVVANLIYASYEFGLDRGFDRYLDYPISADQFLLSSALGRTVSNFSLTRRLSGFHDILGRRLATDVNKDLESLLNTDKGRPFFAFLNYFDVHEPYLPPAPFDRLFDDGSRRSYARLRHRTNSAEPGERYLLSGEERRAEVNAYDGAIAYLDAQLRELFGDLHRRGLLERTFVVITSDHGEEFGERGVFGHGSTLNLAAIHVPLIMVGPGVPRGVRVAQPVSLRDLAATLLSLGTGASTGTSPIPGQPLTRFWEGGTSRSEESPVLSELEQLEGGPAWYPATGGPMLSVIHGGFRYVRGTNIEELYDWEKDFGEERNLAGVEAAADQLRTLRTLASARQGIR